MATYTAVRSTTQTLTGTTADIVKLTQNWPGVEITNWDTTNAIYIRWDTDSSNAVITAVANAAETTPIPAGTSKVIAATNNVPSIGKILLSVVGNGGKYTVEGVQ